MDLTQRKLNKAEWDSIEVPVSEGELEILNMINDGFDSVNNRVNKNMSIFSYLKIEYSQQIEEFLYAKYFGLKFKELVEKYDINFIKLAENSKSRSKEIVSITEDNICIVNAATIVRLKSSDQVRLTRLDNLSDTSGIYEFILYALLEQMLEKRQNNDKLWMGDFYTLNCLLKNNIDKLNCIVKAICRTFVLHLEDEIDMLFVIQNAATFVEKNTSILKYADMTLYEHQKRVYTCVKNPNPKLVLYIAPTGTGKTLTPIGISNQYKIIFVCAARHVGLALARSAISVHKRIAFAFGCSSPEDVRLHYFSAKEFSVNKRTGQIKKVDNTVGEKVEILICDIRSYISAMHYMLAFNDREEIVTYWDEPTITLDYKSHDLHAVIKRNWSENIIPNMVLSSATLPKLHELTQTVADFHAKFSGANVYNITSHDCKKTIPLIDAAGYIVMPHYLHADYADILKKVEQCQENLTLLRYFDLDEVARFIIYAESNNYIKVSAVCSRAFASIDDITMQSIKIHYLKVLQNILPQQWPTVYEHFKNNKVRSIQPLKPSSTSAGVFVTTSDAHTLTDGATIYIAKDLQKIAQFCIQQASIPASVMNDITSKIEFNNQINQRISDIETELELEEQKLVSKMSSGTADTSKTAKALGGKKAGKEKMKIANNLVNKSESRKLVQFKEDIDVLRTMAKQASIDDLFVPNKTAHKIRWAENNMKDRSFTSDIDDGIIVSIMMLKDVADSWKILLLLGIGVFTEHKSIPYTEIMKTLADQQKLYLIIADSDYIYGTNYQFCHGYLGKDLEMTQEKIIQALGRIGRNNIQQQYSARFRDQSHIDMLFANMAFYDKPEVLNMNVLFNSRNVRWNSELDEYEDMECA